MTFVKDTPPAPAVYYPDSDGKPMADNTLQFEWITLLKENLEVLFAEDSNVFVAGDLLWYPVEGHPEIAKAPDVLVVLGRPKGYRGSYQQWQEAGIAPQVVFEILSPSNTRREMSQKLMFYHQYGVEEYYTYDPASFDLRGWIRTDGILEEQDDLQGWVSPRLGIRFELESTGLEIVDPQGQPFLTTLQRERQRQEADRRAQEADRRAQEEAQRAQQEAQRAQEETQRAEQERQRADRLAAHLASLGIDPDRIP
jgi:Uma2 family endonuclease